MKRSDNLWTEIYRFLQKIVVCIFLFFGGLILLNASQFYVHWGLEDGSMAFYEQPWGIFLSALLFVVFAIMIRGILKKIKPTYLFLICMSIYVILGMWLVIFADARITDDPYMVYKYLQCFLSGDFHGIHKSYYFSFVPGNLGLLTYEMPFYLIHESTRLLFFMNLIWVLICEYSLWKITELLFPDEILIHNYVILLETAFVPMLFHILRIYGQLPGAAFISLILFICIRHFRHLDRQKIWLPALGVIILMGMACMVRANYVIASIAIVLVGILVLMKDKKVIPVLVAGAMFLSAIIIPAAERQIYRSVGREYFDSGAPFISYVVMGMTPSPDNIALDGWFNGYTWDNYEAEGYDADKAKVTAIRDFQTLCRRYKEKPVMLKDILTHKIISTWCDPTYECISMGPAEFANGKANKTLLLDSLYSGDYAYMALELIMRVLVLAIYICWVLGAVFALLSKKQEDEEAVFGMMFFILFFIGTFIFHLFWETKSSYVYVCVFWLLPFSAWSINKLGTFLKKQLPENSDI